MTKLVKKIWQVVYRFYGIRSNARVGRRFHLGIWSIVDAPHDIVIGDDVYIGKCCTIECDGSIGDNVMIANNVGLIGRYDHDFRCIGKPIRQAPWIGDPDYRGPGRGLRITIEQDVWVGFGSILLTGVRVGRGAIVAAGAIVTRDVPSYSIAAGNPARVIGYRFNRTDSETHERMLEGV